MKFIKIKDVESGSMVWINADHISIVWFDAKMFAVNGNHAQGNGLFTTDAEGMEKIAVAISYGIPEKDDPINEIVNPYYVNPYIARFESVVNSWKKVGFHHHEKTEQNIVFYGKHIDERITFDRQDVTFNSCYRFYWGHFEAIAETMAFMKDQREEADAWAKI